MLADALDIQEAAAVCGLHTRTVNTYCLLGLLNARKTASGFWLISRQSAEAVCKRKRGRPTKTNTIGEQK